MATYKDDLDIIKAAEKDDKNMTLNAITELDNIGKLNKYGGEGGFGSVSVVIDNPTSNSTVVNYCKVRDDSFEEEVVTSDYKLINQNSHTNLNIVKNSCICIANDGDGVIVDHTEGQIVKLDDGLSCDVYGPGTIVLATGTSPK